MQLIDADELKEELKDMDIVIVKHNVEDLIDEQPTVDAEPVRHGKWYTAEKYNGYLYWNCDQCHQHFTSQKSNFCPNCGAKMDGE